MQKFKQFKGAVISAVLLMVMSANLQASEESLELSCSDFSATDLESLVQPYLDDEMYTAFVMQEQSANYRVSVLAGEVPDENLPDAIKKILSALVKSGC